MSVKWRKLAVPRPWRPKIIGTELIGNYIGLALRSGEWGEYNVAIIAVPVPEGGIELFSINGSQIITALDANNVARGSLIRIVYQGVEEISGGREMKALDVSVGTGRLSEAEIESMAAHLVRA
jgi:hypothetical protein